MFLIIAGHPATGKTTLSEKLKALYPDHTLLHTDDYMQYGYKESLYKLLEDLESYKFQNVIVEGIMGSRLMRKLQEFKQFGNQDKPSLAEDKVDLYVYFSAKFDHIIDVYTRERPGKNLDTIESAIKGLDTVHNSIDLSTQPHLNIRISDFEGMDDLPTIIKTHL